MDIERFREYITLAQCLNYSKAASALYVTQPVLSRHIHDLENQLDVKLLTRDTHKVELTPIGRIFFEEAKKMVECYDKSINHVKQAASGMIGSLMIGFLNAAVEPFLRDFVLVFRKEQPSLTLDFQAMELDDLIAAVKNQQVDVGFATHVAETPELDVIEIFNDKLCAAVDVENPLAEKDEVSVTELSGLPIVCLDRENNLTTYKFNERLFERNNSEFNVVRFVPNIDTGLFFASVGTGIFLLPEHLTNQVSKDTMKVLPIIEPDSQIRLNLISHKDNLNPLAPTFCESFAKYAKEHEGQVFH
ncbi:MAG: LysR family transcriptional regulator [Eubacterium sp.]|nr:LysR family transcriptional regulator [Eubacterium sp.]